jgi:hypothetical protein
MSKTTQNAIDNIKRCVRFLKVSLKEAQSSLEETITWIKNYMMGRLELKESCTIVWLLAKMLRTLVKTMLLCGSSCSKKHWSIKTQFSFAMDNNKLYICHPKSCILDLGCCSNHCKYPIPYYQALCFEPKLRLLVVV